MPKIWIIGRKQIQWLAVGMFAIMLTIAYVRWEQSKPVASPITEERIIQIVTAEYNAQTKAGQKIEAYRWDPGTVYIHEGETLKLMIYGVNGAHHRFYIEGTNIQGEVQKGKVTTVEFSPTEEGIYRLICTTHAGHPGTPATSSTTEVPPQAPMIGYIVVD